MGHAIECLVYVKAGNTIDERILEHKTNIVTVKMKFVFGVNSKASSDRSHDLKP